MSGLSDFRAYFRSFIGLITAGVATTALVLVTALAELAPPWPPAVVQVTAVGQIIVLVLIYQFMKTAPRKTINRRLLWSLVLLVILAIAYLSLHSLTVYEMPNGEFGLKGFACSSDALALYGSDCPFLNRTHIADAEFNADRLWTPLGLMISRLVLIIAWVGMFSSIVFLVGLFVVFQRKVV